MLRFRLFEVRNLSGPAEVATVLSRTSVACWYRRAAAGVECPPQFMRSLVLAPMAAAIVNEK
jgi:hypothetical protein